MRGLAAMVLYGLLVAVAGSFALSSTTPAGVQWPLLGSRLSDLQVTSPAVEEGVPRLLAHTGLVATSRRGPARGHRRLLDPLERSSSSGQDRPALRNGAPPQGAMTLPQGFSDVYGNFLAGGWSWNHRDPFDGDLAGIAVYAHTLSLAELAAHADAGAVYSRKVLAADPGLSPIPGSTGSLTSAGGSRLTIPPSGVTRASPRGTPAAIIESSAN